MPAEQKLPEGWVKTSTGAEKRRFAAILGYVVTDTYAGIQDNHLVVTHMYGDSTIEVPVDVVRYLLSTV